MRVARSRRGLLVLVTSCCILACANVSARADLSTSQARKALTRIHGLELKSGAVRVKSVSASGSSAATVSAELQIVFKFATNEQGRWRIAEIRTGQDRWEQIDLIAAALRTQVAGGECNQLDPPFRGSMAVDPSVKRARCLLGSLLGVELPSDAVRIQSVAQMPIPFASQSSATVVARVGVEARLVKGKTGWQVTELRTGNRDWVALAPLIVAVNEEKRRQARSELELIARALEKFRKDRGFYIVSDSESVAIDHLSPRYLARVIRVDPWHQPYKYLGERDHFTLRSSGPDGKDNTPDDIQLTSSVQ